MKIHLSLALVAYVVLGYPTGADAQSWSGTVAGVELQIARRDRNQRTGFDVYADRGKKELRCGRVDAGVGRQVMFCSDDLDKYSSPQAEAIKVSSALNLLFSHDSVDYWCEASTADSDLFCRLRLSDRGESFSKQTQRVPNQR
jgi:hypothetical protein